MPELDKLQHLYKPKPVQHYEPGTAWVDRKRVKKGGARLVEACQQFVCAVS
jgi:hypothetical protein